MSDSKSSSGGISFVTALTTNFVVLKMTNLIHWSWWWVLSPLWIAASITIVLMGLVLLLVGRR